MPKQAEPFSINVRWIAPKSFFQADVFSWGKRIGRWTVPAHVWANAKSDERRKDLCRAWAIAEMQKRENGAVPPLPKASNELTLTDIAAEYDAKASTGENTKRAYRSYLEHHTVPYLGDIAIKSITTPMVVDLLAHLKVKTKENGKAYGCNHANACIIALKSYLQFCALNHPEYQMIQFPEIKLHRENTLDPNKYFTEEQFDAIAAGAKKIGLKHYVAVLLCGEQGLRRGELRGLTWEHVYFRSRIVDGDKYGSIQVKKQILRSGKVAPTKGKNNRVIPILTQRLRDALIQLKERQNPKTDKEYVLTGTREPIDKWVPETIMLSCTRRASKIDNSIKPTGKLHKLRHTAGTRLGHMTGNLYLVQNFLGHSDPKTSTIYIHKVDYTSAISMLDKHD